MKRAIVVLANCRNTVIYPEISAQTIGNGIASILNTGLLPSPIVYSKPGWVNNIFALMLLGLLIFRLILAHRFKRNLSKKGIRRIWHMISFFLLDILVPITVFIGLPLYMNCTWKYLLNSNMELWYLVFTAAILLAVTGIVKILCFQSADKSSRNPQ